MNEKLSEALRKLEEAADILNELRHKGEVDNYTFYKVQNVIKDIKKKY